MRKAESDALPGADRITWRIRYSRQRRGVVKSGSALAGSILLLLGDLASKGILSPIVLPIGAITSFLRAPLFLRMLFKGMDRL